MEYAFEARTDCRRYSIDKQIPIVLDVQMDEKPHDWADSDEMWELIDRTLRFYLPTVYHVEINGQCLRSRTADYDKWGTGLNEIVEAHAPRPLLELFEPLRPDEAAEPLMSIRDVPFSRKGIVATCRLCLENRSEVDHFDFSVKDLGKSHFLSFKNAELFSRFEGEGAYRGEFSLLARQWDDKSRYVAILDAGEVEYSPALDCPDGGELAK